MGVTINLKDFRGEDFLAQVNAAMAVLKANPGSTLIIPPGKYVMTTPLAGKQQQQVMSGEFGSNPEKVMFVPEYPYDRGIDFYGHDGSRLIADGVVIMVDGFMEPISVRNCRDVEVRGLTVDHVRKPYTKGFIEEITDDPDNEKGSTVEKDC